MALFRKQTSRHLEGPEADPRALPTSPWGHRCEPHEGDMSKEPALTPDDFPVEADKQKLKTQKRADSDRRLGRTRGSARWET